MMEWIQAHLDDLSKAVGYAFLAALAFVKLFPAPKVTETLTKVGSLYMLLCEVFGLNPVQGIGAAEAKAAEAKVAEAKAAQRPQA